MKIIGFQLVVRDYGAPITPFCSELRFRIWSFKKHNFGRPISRQVDPSSGPSWASKLILCKCSTFVTFSRNFCGKILPELPEISVDCRKSVYFVEMSRHDLRNFAFGWKNDKVGWLPGRSSPLPLASSLPEMVVPGPARRAPPRPGAGRRRPSPGRCTARS